MKGGYEANRAIAALVIVYRGCAMLSAHLSDEADPGVVDEAGTSTPMPAPESEEGAVHDR